MDKTKLRNQIRKYKEHLIVDKGIGSITVEGYSRCLSIALRRMRKFCPKTREIRKYILWMHEKKYSYSHIVNSSLAIEHYAKFKGFTIKLGRPRKPKHIIKDVLSEGEVSRMILSHPKHSGESPDLPAGLFRHQKSRTLQYSQGRHRPWRQPFENPRRQKPQGSRRQYFRRMHPCLDRLFDGLSLQGRRFFV